MVAVAFSRLEPGARRAVALVLPVVLAACGSATGPGSEATDIGVLLEYFDVPGAGVAVINDFELDYVEVHGVETADTQEPVTEQTLFQAASISKGVSATGMLSLVQDGTLSLDTEINDYLVRWKLPDNDFQDVEKVTLRRLLSHTAGTGVPGGHHIYPEIAAASLWTTPSDLARFLIELQLTNVKREGWPGF